METVAIYRESIIRTYGFHLLDRLSLFQIQFQLAHLADWGKTMQDMAEQGLSFKLVWARTDTPGRFMFNLLCDHAHSQSVRPFLEQGTHPEVHSCWREITAIDLLFFQGPHFGDRYGIMAYTQQALARQQIRQLASVCSVATIYLVLPAGRGAAAKDALTAAFKIPR